jgi:hypothetical protein
MRYLGGVVAVMATMMACGAFAQSTPTPAPASTAAGKMMLDASPAAGLFPRYKKKEMAAWVEYKLPPDCSQVDTGSWSVDKKPKYGKTSFGTVTGKLANGDCPNKTYTFAAIYYEWTEHNNKSDTDTFAATWKSKDFTEPETFSVKVKIVRPAGETTRFVGWQDTRGLWQQTLIPPGDDPNFDFSGETVKETKVGASDTCNNGTLPPATLTEHTWTVDGNNQWGADGVGWGTNDANVGDCVIEYYRCVKRTPCGSILQQQMQISSPADKGSFHNYGKVNVLSAFIEGFTVPLTKQGVGGITSQRADGAKQWIPHVTLPQHCKAFKVDLSKC